MKPSLYGLPLLALACAPLHAADCRPVRADMIESRTTSGCNPPLTACFIGTVEGDQGLRGTTHFAADSSVRESPKTSPGFIIYSGPFEYRMPTGTLITRETGVSNGSTGQPSGGVVTAHRQLRRRHRLFLRQRPSRQRHRDHPPHRRAVSALMPVAMPPAASSTAQPPRLR